MGEITNENLYVVLLGIKEDIGGLKTASDIQTDTLKGHDTRLDVLEEDSAKHKGEKKIWGVVMATLGSVLGGLGAIATDWFRRR